VVTAKALALYANILVLSFSDFYDEKTLGAMR